MRILFGVSHPKHVHVFKNVINLLIERGHEIKVVAVEKEMTTYLLKKHNIPYDLIGINQPTLLKKIFNLPKWEYNTLKIARDFKPDLYVGRALPHLAHISFRFQKPFIIFEDTEIAKLVHKITLPFATNVVTPHSFKEDLGEKHIRFNGFFDLAYLYPNYFTPLQNIFEELGLSKGDKYIVLRFVSWNASHDIGQSGISTALKSTYISELEKYGRVFISSESKLPSEFKKYELKVQPDKFHSVLSSAQLYIGEGGSTATEAAILGTPSIHISTTAKLCGVFDDLEKYNLIHTFDDGHNALKKAEEILSNPKSKELWMYRKKNMLKEMVDVTMFMTDLIEKYSITSS